MRARCLVVLGYYYWLKNGATMAAIVAKVTAITKMVRGGVESVPFDATVGQPNLNFVRHLVNQLAAFAIHFATTKWGGSTVSSRSFSPRPKYVTPPETKTSPAGASKIPILSTQKLRTTTKGASSSSSNRTSSSTGNSTPFRRC